VGEKKISNLIGGGDKKELKSKRHSKRKRKSIAGRNASTPTRRNRTGKDLVQGTAEEKRGGS